MARRVTTKKPKSAGAHYQIKLPTQPRKRELAEVRLTTKGLNRIEGSFPLYAKAAFENIYIEGKEASYRIHIKVAELALKLEHMDDMPDSELYRRASETAVMVTKEDDKRENKKGRGGGVKFSLGNNIAKISLEAEIGSSQTHSAQEALINKRKVEIVRPLANTKWEIGHEHYGDPDQGGFLKGFYVENDKPLCSLCIFPGKKTATVTATLSTRRNQMHVVKEGDYVSSPSISKSLESDFGDHLMKKLVALRLMKEMSSAETFILARDVLEFEPATEDDL